MPYRYTLSVRCLLALLLFALALPATAALRFIPSNSGAQQFLTADQAFGLQTGAAGRDVLLHFHVTPGYYLYRDRFHFLPQDSALTVVPQFAHVGEWKNDPNFGKVEIYHSDIDVTLKVQGSGNLRIVWQGCADAGLCYPPQSRVITLPPGDAAAPAPASATAPETASASAPVAAAAGSPATTGVPAFLYNNNPVLVLLLLAGLGLGLSFTPCVLPMLPILSGIIARQHTRSAWQGFLLSLAYVLGMATTYALTGLLVGRFGAAADLPAWFQHPVVLIVFALLFAALALSMFGLYELRLPSALHNHFDGLSRRAEGGRYIGSFVMGFFSALVVSPCVSAPLAGVLLYISTTGNALFGALALFCLALGMGIPLLILGATEGSILPRAGDWMNRIKVVFGIMMLGVAILLLGRILPGSLTLLLWAALAAVSAVWLGALEPVQPGVGHLWKGTGVLLLIYSLLLAVGAATGGDDPLMPLSRFASGAAPASSTGPVFQPVKTTAGLDAALQRAAADHRIVMLDFYADWCTTCKDIEKHVFTDSAVGADMGRMMLLRADVTAATADDHALLDRFGLAGPPAILFFRDGRLLTDDSVEGETDAADFLARLKRVTGEP